MAKMSKNTEKTGQKNPKESRPGKLRMWIGGWFRLNDVGIDLGTANSLVCVHGQGIVLEEPTVVAIDADSEEILKIGREAQVMIGRTPDTIRTVRPLKDGVICDYEITMKMLQYFLKRAGGKMLGHPRVVICVPSGVTEVQEKAVRDAAQKAGASTAYLIEEPVAAAIGAGIDISSTDGNMIVDIGGGTTDIAVISMDSVVVSDSIKVAGDKMDEAIIKFLRQKHNLIIGEPTAETIKKTIGSVWRDGEALTMDVRGRCLSQGLPTKVTVSSTEMLEALMPPISEIIDAICGVIERTPPELVADIIKNGIVLTGGGARLRGLDKLIEYTLRIRARVADEPEYCVVKGTGIVLDNFRRYSGKNEKSY